MNDNRFSELVDLYLDNKATDSQREELMQLIREGHGDRLIIDKIQATLRRPGDEEDIDTYKARRMFQNIIENDEVHGKVIPLSRTKMGFQWSAVAAAVLVLAMFGGWLFSQKDIGQTESLSLRVTETESESAFFTGKQFVRLPDGSTVVLNDGSKLSYSTAFGKKIRQVQLSGEGYFDVEHDPSRPFIVVTGEIRTTVLGTTFNVKAYPDQSEVEVSVTSGRVLVGDAERAFGILTPDQQIAVNRKTNDVVQTHMGDEAEELWQSRFIILDNVSLEEAAETIGEKYGVKIILVNDALKTCRISATFLDGENLEQVLTVVSGVVRAVYAIQEDGTVRIEGKGCR